MSERVPLSKIFSSSWPKVPLCPEELISLRKAPGSDNTVVSTRSETIGGHLLFHWPETGQHKGPLFWEGGEVLYRALYT
jgi:hypothetical protein